MAQSSEGQTQKWYKKTWFIVVISLLFWPIGIPYLIIRWVKKSSLSKKAKIVANIGAVVLGLGLLTAWAETVPKTPIPPVDDVVVQNTNSVVKSEDDTTPTEELVDTTTPQKDNNSEVTDNTEVLFYAVTRVVDGDTIDLTINDKTERVRLVGIDTPETVDPRKSVQCFGKEASNEMTRLVLGKKVSLRADSQSADRDVYSRLLRYAYLEDGTDIDATMIKNGFAYAYVKYPFDRMEEFKGYENEARINKRGLWADDACVTATAPTTAPTTTSPTTGTTTITPTEPTSAPTPTQNCTIKGNISSSGEKIYHVIGCGSYNKTIIDEAKGEKLFCTEQEALSAGWRKALNCP